MNWDGCENLRDYPSIYLETLSEASNKLSQFTGLLGIADDGKELGNRITYTCK